jgi:hypothetical protein
VAGLPLVSFNIACAIWRGSLFWVGLAARAAPKGREFGAMMGISNHLNDKEAIYLDHQKFHGYKQYV